MMPPETLSVLPTPHADALPAAHRRRRIRNGAGLVLDR